MRTLLLTCFVSGMAVAQVGGPFLGYVPDGTRVRRMYGLPAAGGIGAAVSSRDYSRTTVSPTQTFVLATTADTGAVMVVKPGSSESAIAGAEANAAILAISPSGTAGAMWFAETNHLQVVTGLPDSPSIRTVDAAFLNESPRAIAVSDDGQWAVGLWSTGVYSFGPSNQVVPLQTDAGVSAFAFFHRNHDVALANGSRATAILDVGGAMQSSVLFDYSAQPISPRAIGVSFDNQRTVVADASGLIVSAASVVDCHCSPEGLDSLGAALFRLNGSAGARGGVRQELKLFDAATGAVLIVPPMFGREGGRQ